MLAITRFKMIELRGVEILLFISCCMFAPARSQPDAVKGTYLTDNFLLLTELRSEHIFQVSLDGTTIQLPIPALNPMGAAYDPNIQKVFWVSQGDQKVMSSQLNGTELTLIKRLTSAQSPEGIAIDPDEKFIFYTDGGLDSVNLVSYDGKMHLQIVMNAKNPRAIETDRKYKNIYWTDWGLETIEMTDYDGANRKVIITRPGSWMNGLALDIEGRKMYWTDAKLDRLERANIDGSNIKTLLNHNNTMAAKNGSIDAHYFGVAVDKQNIYFSDWNRNGVYKIPIQRTGDTPYQYTRLDTAVNMSRANGISIYKSATYYKAPPSPCVNHRCSDLCIPLKSGYRCACPDMRRLDINSRTCLPGLRANGPDVIWLEHDGFLSGWVRGVKGAPSVYLRAKRIHAWSYRSPAFKWTAIDTNFKDSMMYMYDNYDRYFVQLPMNGTLKVKSINYGSSSQVNGLAYDWLSHNLYWTDSLYNWIAMMKIGTNYTRTLIETTLDKPHGIAVYPQKGRMYWTDWGENQRIQQASMDGTNVMVLVKSGLNKPMGITVDYDKNRLFWTNTEVIESYDLITNARTQYGRQSQNDFIGVAIYKNFMFATDQGIKLKSGRRSRPNLWFFDINSENKRGLRLPLNRQPFGITMYAASRQKEDPTAPCAVTRCAHLCVPVPLAGLTAQCLCRDGYSTTDNGKTCKPMSTSQGAMYVYALQDRVCAVPVRKTMMKTMTRDADTFCFFNSTAKGYKFRAVDFNYREGEIYFTEYGTSVKTIRRARLEKKNKNSVLVYGTGDVRGLVVDWMTSNMYWTDVNASAIWVSRLEGQFMRQIIKNISNPGAIALDMQTKRLFWTESLGNLSKIMVAKLDGSNPSTFFKSPSSVANSTFTSLAVDYVEQRIYWATPSSIWSASLIDGSEKRMQRSGFRFGQSEIYGVAVMQDFIGFTEKTTHGRMHVIEKETGREMTPGGMRHYNQQAVYGITAYYSGNQPLFLGNASSSCDIANGRCEQLCFPMPTGHKCGCTDSMKVSHDGVSCEPSSPIQKDKFFLIADDYRRQIYQTDEDLKNIHAFKFPQNDRPIGLTYDFVSNRVFWADYNSHVVKSMFLNGSDVMTLFGELARSRTEGLAFDSASQMLYYTDSGRDIVATMNPTGKYHKVLINGIKSPRAIVLDPQNGYMYVTSRKTGEGRITRYTMDGQNETDLVNTGLSWPNGLEIDFTKKKIYWCDAHTEVIGSADLDGGNQVKLFTGDTKADPFDIAVHGDYIYWTDWAIKGLFRISLDGTGVTRLRTDLFSGLNDIKFFNKAERTAPTTCTDNNGGCSHFCNPTANNNHMCACPDKFGRSVETIDGRNCPGVTACPVVTNLEKNCTYRLGFTCRVKCRVGYHPTIPKIRCVKGLKWDADVNSLCEEDKTCPLLQTPDNAKDTCTGSGIGDTCTHTCFANSTAMSGDKIRRCTSSYLWTGNPLICRVKTCRADIQNGKFDASCKYQIDKACKYTCNDGYWKTTNMSLMCQMNATWNTDVMTLCKSNDASHTSQATGKHDGKEYVGMTVGIVITVLVLVAVIVAGLFLVWRRRQNKMRSMYRESSPVTNGTSSYDTPEATPGDLSPTYSVGHASVNLEGSIAFDNPVYGSLPPKHTEDATIAPGDVGVDVITTPEQTACANPLFGIKEKDKTLLLDDV